MMRTNSYTSPGCRLPGHASSDFLSSVSVFDGKGYLGPYFARVAMLLFPGFYILVGIACADLQLRLRNNRTLAFVLTGAFLLVLGPSVVFDIAYGRAMQQKDARQVLREDCQKLIAEAPVTIGIWHYGPYFYTIMPAANPLKSEKAAVELHEPGQTLTPS